MPRWAPGPTSNGSSWCRGRSCPMPPPGTASGRTASRQPSTSSPSTAGSSRVRRWRSTRASSKSSRISCCATARTTSSCAGRERAATPGCSTAGPSGSVGTSTREIRASPVVFGGSGTKSSSPTSSPRSRHTRSWTTTRPTSVRSTSASSSWPRPVDGPSESARPTSSRVRSFSL